jgi:hypothetical protein
MKPDNERYRFLDIMFLYREHSPLWHLENDIADFRVPDSHSS